MADTEEEDFILPPMGSEPDAVVEFVNKNCYDEWKSSYRPWHRQVEENLRMLSGRQWDCYVESANQFVDISSYFATGDERWRQYPVFNWLQSYFKQTLSKLTENIPAVGAMPASSDYKDALLAEVVEPIWRYEWDQMGLPEKMFDLYGWVLVAGRGILKLRWDTERGPMEEFYGPAMLSLQDEQGQPFDMPIENAPYTQDASGAFVPHVLGSQNEAGDYEVEIDDDGMPMMGDAFIHYQGDFAADVVTPTSVVVPHGPEPFDEKPWYTHEYLLSVEQARLRFPKADIQPDDLTGDEDLLVRLQYGSHFGMPGSIGQGAAQPNKVATRGMVRIREHWRRAVANHPDLKYGRLIIVTKTLLLHDDINPYVQPGKQPHAIIPFYAFDLVKLPFKQEGTTDFEFLNPVQRSANRRMGALLDSVEMNEQPLTIVNSTAGLDEQMDQLNRPGAQVIATWAGNGPPIDRLPAVELPQSSVQVLEILQEWMYRLSGSNESGSGNAATADASGELQREVRYDADRPWGATLRRHSYVWARIVTDVHAILGVVMDDQRLLTISGEENAWKFLMVRPEMFEGRVHIRPQPESAVLESRQDRQNRVMNLVQLGMLPPDLGLQQLNYPDLSRVARPNYDAYVLAQREHAEMVMGQLSPVLLEHDHLTHLLEHKKVQQTTEYRNMPPEIQQIFRTHIQFHEMLLPEQAMHDAMVMAPLMPADPAADPAGSEPSGSQPPPQ